MLAAYGLGRLSESSATAQERALSYVGSCSRGEVMVFEDASHLRCVDAAALRPIQCADHEFLGTDGWGRLRCVGPSRTSWGARGLLPVCSSGEIVVSEGFGRWGCSAPPTGSCP